MQGSNNDGNKQGEGGEGSGPPTPLMSGPGGGPIGGGAHGSMGGQMGGHMGGGWPPLPPSGGQWQSFPGYNQMGWGGGPMMGMGGSMGGGPPGMQMNTGQSKKAKKKAAKKMRDMAAAAAASPEDIPPPPPPQTAGIVTNAFCLHFNCEIGTFSAGFYDQAANLDLFNAI